MKKIFNLFMMVIIAFCFAINVYATDYTYKQIIPIDDTANVSTKTFDYTNVSYMPIADGRKYAIFNIGGITNKIDKSMPLSVNILIYDKNKKNIGFVTYCSDQDYDSDYSQHKVKAKETVPLSINIVDKYFVEGKTAADIAYFSILDENVYCKIGGYDKYAGLTVEEIVKGGIKQDKKGSTAKVKSFDAGEFLKIFGIGFVICVGLGILLNALYKRMYAEMSFLAFIPLGNCFIAFKMAFGDLVSKIYAGLLLIAVVLSFVVSKTILFVVAGFAIIALIIDIVKLITKKYDLLILDPKNNMQTTVSSANEDATKGLFINEDLEKDEKKTDSNGDSNFVSSGSGQEVIDLNYTGNEDTTQSTTLDEEAFKYSNVFDDPSIKSVSTGNSESNSNDNNNNNKEGESDLANFFK